MQAEPLLNTVSRRRTRTCELCNVPARVVVVVFASYLLTLGRVHKMYLMILKWNLEFSGANVKRFCKL